MRLIGVAGFAGCLFLLRLRMSAWETGLQRAIFRRYALGASGQHFADVPFLGGLPRLGSTAGKFGNPRP
jgi:hypothetical protein